MSTEVNKQQTFVFNTPIGVDVELLFSDFSISFKPKVEFLIHQINYYNKNGGYQVHSKNHCWFFGIKGSELATILKRLVDSGIIVKTQNYSPGNKSSKYKMVKPFDKDIAKRNYYNVDEIQFLRKWVADNCIVKSAATSNFKKTLSPTASLIAEQKREIAELKALLNQKSNDSIVIVPLEPAINDVDTTQEEEDIFILREQVAEDIVTHVYNEDIVSIEESKDSEVVNTMIMAEDAETNVQESNGITEVVLSDNLSTHIKDDVLYIFYNGKMGCILNYGEFEQPYSKLPNQEKVKFLSKIMTSPLESFFYPLNKILSILLSKQLLEDYVMVTYEGIRAA